MPSNNLVSIVSFFWEGGKLALGTGFNEPLFEALRTIGANSEDLRASLLYYKLLQRSAAVGWVR